MTIQWGDGGDLQWETAMVGHIPSLAARFRIGIRVFFGGCGGSSEPRSPSPRPHLPFMCAVRQGPTNRIRVGLPRSGSRDKGPGLLVEIN